LSVKRRDLVEYFEEHGFYLLREGKKHAIYTNGVKTMPIKRHRIFDRITANELCKQAGLTPKF
jgi:mRNA interferase HicA